jgi:uncharacterized repeat protein (TIGR01451 family)
MLRLRCALTAVLAWSMVLMTSTGVAGGQQAGPAGTGSWVTFAARVCPSYADISANKARNNIQESLRDLGPNTPYAGPLASSLVVPGIEQASQPRCTPLSGWRFRLGTGIAPQKVVGRWGSLSVVSGAYAGIDLTTQPSIHDRDDDGIPTTATIAGATEVQLTADQLQKAQAGSLWLQGGTESDPVLDQQYPGAYGFGALRCATDDVNGDNVEYIKLPAKHVYCFAYYVQPPPTSGTIVIRKEVASPAGADATFSFAGNVSFEANHQFSLAVEAGKPAAMTFYRAATDPADPETLWKVDELVPTGWKLDGISCPKTAGGSVATPDPAKPAGIVIDLHAGDTITCTYTDELVPPPGQLDLEKITTGGVGTFPLVVRDSAGKVVVDTTATTTTAGVAAPAARSPFTLDPGTYTVSEPDVPAARGGFWTPTAVNCNAKRVRGRRGLETTITITSARGAVCRFTNAFVPTGSIAVSKVTEDDLGLTGFVITNLDHPELQYAQAALTTTAGQPALARGDSTRRLPLGRYVIQETQTVPHFDADWQLLSISCGGRLLAFEQGRALIELTREHPRRRCRFVNAHPTEEPPEPTPPEPEPPTPTPAPPPVPPVPAPTPAPPLPVGPASGPPTLADLPAPADLVLTKRALTDRVRAGSIATFEIVVRNTGAAGADDVVVADLQGHGEQLVSARPSQGTCGEDVPIICRLGTLRPDARATVRVRARATTTSTMINRAIAGSRSRETTLNNNHAHASAAIRDAGPVTGTCSRNAPAAHAAC